jgi:hypothetical protein
MDVQKVESRKSRVKLSNPIHNGLASIPSHFVKLVANVWIIGQITHKIYIVKGIAKKAQGFHQFFLESSKKHLLYDEIKYYTISA